MDDDDISRTPDVHALSPDEALAALRSEITGLSAAEAERRLAVHGPNLLRAARLASAWEILVGQLRSIIVVLLFVAALVALYLGEPLDAVAIFVVLLLNTLIGFTTEFRARRAMEALRDLQTPRATTVRDGRILEIDSAELVPGDIILVEAGEAVPADARIVYAAELRTDEAALSGESVPADKDGHPLPPETPLADRDNMLYQGTTVVAGSARAVVVATGMETELGKIGGLVEAIEEEPTPLERRLDRLGRNLVWLALATVVVVVAVPVARGASLGLMIETGLALAIAAVPEGLPAVVTITLAVSVRRMAARRALVRRLPAVESLGSATVVCTDKTGTLTAGEMTLTTILLPGEGSALRTIEVTGSGYEPRGEFLEEGQLVDPGLDSTLALALRAAALSSHGDVVRTETGWAPRGDPTEAAILAAARKAGLDPDALLAEEPRAGEVPFSSERMFAVSFHELPGEPLPGERPGGDRLTGYLKGAPGRILDLCTLYLTPAGPVPLDPDARERLRLWNDDLASHGLRVLALAVAAAGRPEADSLAEIAFIGLVGMIDPPAPGVPETISRLHEAGIRTIMVTGDQRLTAEAVARQLGVDRVYSRVDPADKLEIISALQQEGEIVAMLGDGVNDAAALKKADIGVAMGGRGTDAAREASDVVLQDDRFQTVAAAVEEGRVAFDNIRKFVFYLFSCNIAEILVIFLAGLAGYPAILAPLQILWLNLITDTFPALSLAFEPAEPDIMRRPPRDPGAAILSSRFAVRVLGFGALITISTLIAIAWGIGNGDATTPAFMTIALAQIFHLANARGRGPLTSRRILSNPYAIGAVALTIGLQFLAVYLPPLADVLRLRPLAAGEWFVIFGLALIPAMIGQLIGFLGAMPNPDR